MDTIGLDLHNRESQLCILGDDGSVSGRRIATSRERFAAVLGDRPPARVLLEASTESEWVARHLESFEHAVIVAGPNYAAMYATRARRVKTDKRDARTLAEALRLGAYRPAHRVSAAQRHVRAELAVREALVRTRTRYVSIAKALVRRDGLRVGGSEAHLAAQRIAALELSETLAAELAPLFAVLGPIDAEIAAAEQRIARLVRDDRDVARLATAPSVGPITASAVVAVVDDITRFRSAHEFEAFLGLVAGEKSSGEKRRIGRITKAGNSRVRCLLVEAGWRILRSKSDETAALRGWALAIAARRGTKVAAVALAPAGGDPLRDLARRRGLRREQAPRTEAAPRRGRVARHGRQHRAIEMTAAGRASASQLMAAVESRELVGATRSHRTPKCAEACGPHPRARTEG